MNEPVTVILRFGDGSLWISRPLSFKHADEIAKMAHENPRGLTIGPIVSVSLQEPDRVVPEVEHRLIPKRSRRTMNEKGPRR